MGAVIMLLTVCLIAIVGLLYFNHQDKQPNRAS